ncbi:hypothetical protein CORC01_14433 [Colletotrichum orchidophilum]|uniref:Uncharacterized protein n=1 Tax=Colletotrichum orchidophilum TaxID=1209926 RepID=A0A1G4AM75_9PEZI|nr:uncharacterized protein CORC01_14433 [Colletotrichum orchidophilum]OHE90274.1 hypothetical protein CORC01_14433 [Colletotrichum orchidophilum]
MYQQQSSGPPFRDPRLAQRRPLFYLSRPRGIQNGGNGGHGSHQQAAGGEVRTQRQPPTAAAVQGRDGRDGLHGGSIRSQLPQDSSITRPQENPQNTSPTQEQNLELVTYISENFGTLQQLLSDFTDRYVYSPGSGH